MKKSTYRKTLDLQKSGVQFTVNAVMNEAQSRQVELNIVDGGKPFDIAGNDVTAILYAIKPDGTTLYNSCTISGNKATYVMTTQTVNVAGDVKARLQIIAATNPNQVLYAPEFIIAVEDNADYSEAEPSADEYSALTTATAAAVTATNSANAAATLANTKAGLADTAATNANTKASLADAAATEASAKAVLANTAASNADTATANANAATASANAAIAKMDNIAITAEKDTRTGITTITITDKDGNDVVIEVKDGRNGGKGDPGNPGYSPSASVERNQANTGAVITITDRTGTSSVTVYDGQDGVDGSDGSDGQDGQDGHDGVDGTDGLGFTGELDGTSNSPTDATELSNGLYVVASSKNTAYVTIPIGEDDVKYTIQKGGFLLKTSSRIIILANQQLLFVKNGNVYNEPIPFTEATSYIESDEGGIQLTMNANTNYVCTDAVESVELTISGSGHTSILFSVDDNVSEFYFDITSDDDVSYANGFIPTFTAEHTYLVDINGLRVEITEFCDEGEGSSGGGSNALYFTDKAIAVNDWIDNTTSPDTDFEDYDYKAVISCSGVTADMFATVIFNDEQAESGDYSESGSTGAGTVTIYSNSNAAITIPTIVAGAPLSTNIDVNINSQFADGSVTTPKLASSAVTTPKIADNAVTPDKLSAEAKGHHYSTTEHVVGTWITGKPLYEITATVANLTGNTVKNIITDFGVDNDYDYVFVENVLTINKYGTWINGWDNIQYMQAYYQPERGDIHLGNFQDTPCQMLFTFRYTKSTDAAIS